LISDTDIILLDEPTESLDAADASIILDESDVAKIVIRDGNKSISNKESPKRQNECSFFTQLRTV